MGFVERLKQYEAAEALVDSQREAELNRRREVEIEFHELRREQAKTVQQDSGVNILIQDFRNFLGLRVVYDSGADQRNSNCDPDSAYQAVKWDERKIYTHVLYSAGSRSYEPREGRMDEYKGKFIMIESQPGGNIVFYANGTITVSEQEWKNSKDTLELALVQSYKNPRIIQRFERHEMRIIKPIPYYANMPFSHGNGIR